MGLTEMQFSGCGPTFLKDPKVCIYRQSSKSKLLPLETGVPQGSILGPTFYILFTSQYSLLCAAMQMIAPTL